MKRLVMLAVAACLLTGCAGTTDVQAVAVGTPIKVVYIQRNAAADDVAPDLESAIENGLQRHGIGTKEGQPPSDNDYSLTYAADGGWDLKPYSKSVELRLKRGARQVGYARYDSAMGMNTSKFAPAREKITPAIDQMLAGFR